MGNHVNYFPFVTPFFFRAAEHRILQPRNKHLKNLKPSAISDHLLTYDCKINLNDIIILSKDSNNFNSLIKESILIAPDKPILNKSKS